MRCSVKNPFKCHTSEFKETKTYISDYFGYLGKLLQDVYDEDNKGLLVTAKLPMSDD